LNYRNKTYTYLLKLMNEFSFSIWMLDDACRSRSNWELCVAEYTQDDINYALNILKNKYGIMGKQGKDKRYVTFDADSSRKIDKIILNNIPNNLDIIKYKILENDISKQQKSIYVKYENKDIRLNKFCEMFNLDYKSTWQNLNRGLNVEDIINKKVMNL